MAMLGAAATLIAFWFLANLWAPAAGTDFPSTGRFPTAYALAAADVDARTEIPVRSPAQSAAQSGQLPLFSDENSAAIVSSLPSTQSTPPVRIAASPARHDGVEFEIAIRFAEPVRGTGFLDWPFSLLVESGEIRALSQVDRDGFEWSARIAPQGRRSVGVSLAQRSSCPGAELSCLAVRSASRPETRVVVAGPPVSAHVVEHPTHHMTGQPVEVLIELSEPVWAGLREIRDRAIQVTNGRVLGVNRVDGRHDLWRVSLLPELGADLEVAFSPRIGCGPDGLRCTGDLHRIVDEFGLTIPAARLHLTFDDGPHPRYTPQVLDVLARYQARATFFVVGSSAAAFPELIERIVREGHTLANHTWNHESLDGISEQDFNTTLNRTQDLLGEHATACMRPPYYAMDEHTVSRAEKLGLRVVLGEIRPRDWTKPGALEIANRLVASAAHGRIAILHDGGGDRTQTIEGLELALAYLEQFGYAYEPICR
ncbi:MAG: polysaccharide deacetylase family protein [Chloroflexi bacterium]|nr:polysaccharide deacetylase family protein [Chloroflexota bacterium]